MIGGPSSSRNAVPANREVSPAGGGLELQREVGQWLSVPPVPDSLVVNIGDYMHLLTGGRFKTPYHRVTMPEAGGAGGADERTSFVFFAYPEYSTRLSAAGKEQDKGLRRRAMPRTSVFQDQRLGAGGERGEEAEAARAAELERSPFGDIIASKWAQVSRL